MILLYLACPIVLFTLMSTSPSIPSDASKYLEEYNGNTLLAIAAIFIVLETIFVGLRYYARSHTTAATGWDDILIPLTWFTNIGLCILGISQNP